MHPWSEVLYITIQRVSMTKMPTLACNKGGKIVLATGCGLPKAKTSFSLSEQSLHLRKSKLFPRTVVPKTRLKQKFFFFSPYYGCPGRTPLSGGKRGIPPWSKPPPTVTHTLHGSM